MLRDYQLRAIEDLRSAYRERPILCLPTGSGKTSVAAELIRLATAKGNRCIFLVHRAELLDQAVARLDSFGIQAGKIMNGHREERGLPVQVASIPTLIRREHWPAEIVIVDECSHAVSDSWKEVLARYSTSWIIGLTATPIRLDGRGLGDIFGRIVEPVSTQELIDQGHLVKPKVFAPPIDLSKIKVKMGEYDLPQLGEHMNKLVGDLRSHWHEHAFGMRTVVFAVNVDHSQRIVTAFKELGVRAAHLDYKMSKTLRRNILVGLREGFLDMVSNVMLLSEGWDLPSLQCAVLARPTKSLALFRQMVGRVMRPPGPVVVLDHAGNHHEHGPVTDPIEWSLDAKRKTTRVPVAGFTTCKECYAIIDAPPCPECGWAPEVKADEAPPIDAPGQLVEYAPPPKTPKVTRDQKESRYCELVARANQWGYSLGYARNKFREEFGVWPVARDIERELYRCPGHDWLPRQYGAPGWHRCSKCYEERQSAY